LFKSVGTTGKVIGSTILKRGIFWIEGLWGSPSSNFQSSLRDSSSFESLPRTASWARFSRPFGTSHADSGACVSIPSTFGRCDPPGPVTERLPYPERLRELRQPLSPNVVSHGPKTAAVQCRARADTRIPGRDDVSHCRWRTESSPPRELPTCRTPYRLR
jgi:hypothetical protein